MIIYIKKSFILTAIVLSAHAGALLLIVVLPIALALKIGLAALIGASSGGKVGMAYRRVCAKYGWRKTVPASEPQTASSVAIGLRARPPMLGFVRLTLKRAGERTRIQLLPRDAVEPEVYRDLRARIVQRRLPVPDKTPA